MSSYLVWISEENNYHAKNIDGLTHQSIQDLFYLVNTFGVSAKSADDAIRQAKEAGFSTVSRISPVHRPDRPRTIEMPAYRTAISNEFMETLFPRNKKDN